MVNRLVAAIGLALLGGCTFPEQPLPPGERHLMVHAVLDPSRRVQVVQLTASDGSQVTSGDIDNAVVTIITPDGATLTAVQDTARELYPGYVIRAPIYRIDLDDYGVDLVPGGTYQLQITTANGEVITGTMTIPTASPASTSVDPTFFRLRDTLRLGWNAVPGARTYELQVWSTYQYGPSDYRRLRYTRFTADQLSLAGTAKTVDDDPIFEINARVVAYLYAVDANYYDYYRVLGDPFVGAPPSKLNGALGLFGSVVPIVSRQFEVR